MTHTNPSFPLPDPRQLPADVGDLLAGLADHLPELVAVMSGTGQVLWFNAAAEEVLGWERSHWIGRSALDLVHPEDLPLARELLVSARSTGTGTKEPVTYRMASAHTGWVSVEVVASTVELASGRSVFVVSARPGGVARDSGAIAQEVADRLSAMFDASAFGMAQVRLDGRILRVNQRFAELLDRPAVTLVDADVVGLLQPRHDRGPLDRPLLDLVRDGEQEWTVRLGSGSPRDVRLSASLVRDWQGEPMYVALHLTDVTALLAADRARRPDEAQLRAAVALTADGVVFVAPDGTVTECNERARLLLDPDGGLTGRTLLQLLDAGTAAELDRLARGDGPRRLDLVTRTRAAAPRTVMVTAARPDGDTGGLVVTVSEPAIS